MEIAIGVLGLLAAGFGAWVFVLIRAQGAVRDELRDAVGARDVLAAENERVNEETRRVRKELAEATSKAEESSGRVVTLSVENAEIKAQLSGAEKRYLDLVNDEKRLKDAFKAMGAETLKENTEQLGRILTTRLKDSDKLSQAELDERKVAIESLVKPIRETLDKTQEQITQLDERVKASGTSNESLIKVTAKLSQALSKPHVRGQYGEIQLQRVAELAGMTSYCDFSLQDSRVDDEGSQHRPDMVVHLPNDRVIVVDAKANISAYFDAVNAENESDREGHLKRFGKHIKEQTTKLSSKQYWKRYERAPEFVVMFVPGDHFIDEALTQNPDLVEFAATQNVILASPSTLIGLLRAVALGWEEHRLSENALELRKLGEELLGRAEKVFEHTTSLGRTLRQTVDHYNSLVGSIDSRLYPTLKRFEENKETTGQNTLTLPTMLDSNPRQLAAGSDEGE